MGMFLKARTQLLLVLTVLVLIRDTRGDLNLFVALVHNSGASYQTIIPIGEM
jgi:hypothetical protein